MLLTPLLLVAADRWWIPLLVGQQAQRRRPRADASRRTARSIIAGFGRYGQIVGRLLFANGITPTVLDHDAEQIEALRKFGWRVFYGDATRLDLLRTAGADKAQRARAGDRRHRAERRLRPDACARTFPTLTIVARARNVQHYYELYELGVTMIERETLDSALMSARSALEALGWQPHQARNLALRFRRHNVAQLAALAPHRKDEAKLIAAAKQGRQQLEELFAIEREQAAATPGARRLERDRRHRAAGTLACARRVLEREQREHAGA